MKRNVNSSWWKILGFVFSWAQEVLFWSYYKDCFTGGNFGLQECVFWHWLNSALYNLLTFDNAKIVYHLSGRSPRGSESLYSKGFSLPVDSRESSDKIIDTSSVFTRVLRRAHSKPRFFSRCWMAFNSSVFLSIRWNINHSLDSHNQTVQDQRFCWLWVWSGYPGRSTKGWAALWCVFLRYLSQSCTIFTFRGFLSHNWFLCLLSRFRWTCPISLWHHADLWAPNYSSWLSGA